MMTSALNELLSLVTGLREQETQLRAQFEGRLAELAGQIAAVQTTIDLLTQSQPANEIRQLDAVGPTPANGWAKKLAGLTQAGALRVIARENDGILEMREARRIFVMYGLSKGDPKYVGGHIYHILEGLPEFEHMGKGTGKFRLKGIQQSKHDQSPTLFSEPGEDQTESN